MIPLAITALIIYATAFAALAFLREHNFYKISKERLAKWVLNPDLAHGEIRDILDYVNDGDGSLDNLRNRYSEISNVYLSRIERTRRFLLILTGTAPLMGLLGTVTGMLSTFRGLSSSTGGQTVDLVASGISEALITTQTGLVIAIPAYVIAYRIARKRDEMQACLMSMETISVQLAERGNNLSETA